MIPITLLLIPLVAASFPLTSYVDYDSLPDILSSLTNNCDGLIEISTIGNSTQQRPLYLIEISNSVGNYSTPKPLFRYTGTIHGNEPLGMVLLPSLANYLCESYNALKGSLGDSTSPPGTEAPYIPSVATPESRRLMAYRLVRDARVMLIPAMNPDGYVLKQRENFNNQDLNRNFPDPISMMAKNPGLMKVLFAQSLEVAAVMRLAMNRRAVASAVLHEGSIVANYPWDGTVTGAAHYNESWDDATFRNLALSYSKPHARMGQSEIFPNGITNGAAWYTVRGGSQDWNYVASQVHTMELTLELDDVQTPDESRLSDLFDENLGPMLNLAHTALFSGVRGRVLDAGAGPSRRRSLIQQSPDSALEAEGDAAKGSSGWAARLFAALSRSHLSRGDAPIQLGRKLLRLRQRVDSDDSDAEGNGEGEARSAAVAAGSKKKKDKKGKKKCKGKNNPKWCKDDGTVSTTKPGNATDVQDPTPPPPPPPPPPSNPSPPPPEPSPPPPDSTPEPNDPAVSDSEVDPQPQPELYPGSVRGASILVGASGDNFISPMNVTSGSLAGEFYRPLAPGRWTLYVSAPGFVSREINISIPADGSGVYLDIELERSS